MLWIFQLLPEPKRSEFLSLWKEYNNCSTPEAHLVKALDKAETNAVIEHTQEKENHHL
ncbi:HD domain-containing protein [Mediterraneibacter gnavus]|uniref:HD domain-containing protein n=1 Tax=Mediterraneibacter gnavus TaxID=33038 RepID=UPI002FE63404